MYDQKIPFPFLIEKKLEVHHCLSKTSPFVEIRFFVSTLYPNYIYNFDQDFPISTLLIQKINQD